MELTLPQRCAQFYQVLRAKHMNRYRNRALLLSAFVEPNSVVIDVGAHHGFYTKEFARVHNDSCKVLAIEPFSYNFSILSEVVEEFDNVELKRCALGEKLGVAQLVVPLKQHGKFGTSLGHIGRETKEHITEVVPLRTLDDFSNDPVSFVKIDVEGGEYGVLSGGKALIERCAPVFLIEVEEEYTRRFGKTPAEVFELLGSQGYSPRIVDWSAGRFEPVTKYTKAGDYIFLKRRQ